MNSGAARDPRRRLRFAVRAVALVATTTALLLLGSAALSPVRRDAAAATAAARSASWIQPTVQFLAALADQQSAAVRGDRPNWVDVNAALARIVAVDDGGDPVLTSRRQGLEQHLEGLRNTPGRADTAYSSFSAVIDLTLDLLRRAAEAAETVPTDLTGPRHLAGAAALHLPELIAEAGRLEDLSRLAVAAGPAAAAPMRAKAQVARHQLAAAGSALETDLELGLDGGEGSEVVLNLVGGVDRLHDLVGALAPSATLTNDDSSAADPGTLASDRADLAEAAARLTAGLSTSVRAQFADRRHAADRAALTIMSALAGAVLCLLVLIGTSRTIVERGFKVRLSGAQAFPLLGRTADRRRRRDGREGPADGVDGKGPHSGTIEPGRSPRSLTKILSDYDGSTTGGAPSPDWLDNGRHRAAPFEETAGVRP
ncbi:hypothetical protein [Streptomyces sp. TLI_171]|uniref:hypothetical protein n=1 Tax=Streptomyces sp. TLI_171 TaxID=1938859 RepID=UPI00117F62C9|nr:hypothetical protein [Streptomyces sp. TLI_171]